jgi:hypothetical protein
MFPSVFVVFVVVWYFQPLQLFSYFQPFVAYVSPKGFDQTMTLVISCGLVLATYLVALLFMAWCVMPLMVRTLQEPLRRYVLPITMSSVRLPPETLRSQFNDLPLTEAKAVIDHTHGEAAADRTAASSFIDRLAANLGLNAFYFQRSRADERNRRHGSREFYWAKDFGATPSNSKPRCYGVAPGLVVRLLSRLCRWFEPVSGDLVALVDVDQYVDMPKFMCKHLGPVLLYTFQPDHVAKVASNYSYTFTNDVVDYYVTGGGKYSHQVWNYSLDHVTVSSTFLGFPTSCAVYNVDRRKTSDDHELILFTPIGYWGFHVAWLPMLLVSHRSLTRLKLFQPRTGFNRLVVSSLQGVFVATGRPGTFCSAKVPVAIDDTIASVSRTSKHELSLPQVLSFVDGDRTASAALLEYHRLRIDAKPDVVCPVPMSVRRYQFDVRNFSPDAKPSLIAFMSPLVHGAFAPDVTKANESQAVAGRITAVKPAFLPMTPFLARVMMEFATFLISETDKHSLDPVDYDFVLDAQSSPSQRRILSESECMLPIREAKTFNKKESYGNVKDPRIITTINGVDKREYSMFTYAFAAVLKRQDWYAFGKSPIAISQRVVNILRHASAATNTDFSRFDGHGSNLMREIERICLLRAFRPMHHAKLLELHRSQYNLAAVGALGTKYDQAFARASGSPETSLFNSLVNAFVAYLAIRSTKRDGSFIEPAVAYASLGIYGGDDGITTDVDSLAYSNAAKAIGQDITIQLVPRGSLGIKFLARVYSPDVWFGDENTCCDISRTLSKFHTTVAMRSDVTPAMKLLEKTRCLLLSDRHTPIVGEFCAVVERIYGGAIPYDARVSQATTWLASSESQYVRTLPYSSCHEDL